jgi:hypothetical protein
MPQVAMFLVDWAFHHGAGGMERDIAKWQREKLGIVDKNITKQEIYANILKSGWNQEKLMISLLKRRKERLTDLAVGSKKVFWKGWMNRVNRFAVTFCSDYVRNSLGITGYY